MKIGFDAKRVYFNRSGLGNYSRSTVELLYKHCPEHEYVLFSPKHGNPYNFEIPENIGVVYPEGIDACFANSWRSYHMSRSLRREKLDIFHGLSNELPADMRKAGTRSVVTIHDLIFVRYPQLYRPMDRYFYTLKYGKSCRMADRIIAVSNQTKADLVDYWDIAPEKIEVIYQGCNPKFYKQVSEEEKARVRAKYQLPRDFILSVGTIENRKNLMLTAKAMAVTKNHIDVDLVACGRHTPYSTMIADFAAKNGIGQRIHFRHDIHCQDMPALYQMSRALVYTSIFEGFGIPILEALNSGIPVITSRGGVFTETGGDACLYVDPYDLESMIDKLRKVLENETLRKELVAKGYLHAQKFREPYIAENLNRLYQQMV